MVIFSNVSRQLPNMLQPLVFENMSHSCPFLLYFVIIKVCFYILQYHFVQQFDEKSVVNIAH